MYVSSPCTPDSPLYALAHCFYNGYRLHHFRKAGRLPLVLRGRIGFAYRYDSHNRIHGRFVTEVTRRHGPDASCRTSNCSPTTFRPVNEISLAWRTETTERRCNVQHAARGRSPGVIALRIIGIM